MERRADSLKSPAGRSPALRARARFPSTLSSPKRSSGGTICTRIAKTLPVLYNLTVLPDAVTLFVYFTRVASARDFAGERLGDVLDLEGYHHGVFYLSPHGDLLFTLIVRQIGSGRAVCCAVP